MNWIEGFPPIASAAAHTLILGSMPSRESLARHRYYAHPRNAFWPILVELLGLDSAGMSTDAKRAALRAYREAQYEKLIDAVYERRGWTQDGVPTLKTLADLGIDYPDVVQVVKEYL